MNRLSWSLIIARLSQLAVLLPAVYLVFRNVDFSEPIATPIMIIAFCVVIFSVVASSIGQNVEIHLKTKDLLPFKIDIDKTIEIMGKIGGKTEVIAKPKHGFWITWKK